MSGPFKRRPSLKSLPPVAVGASAISPALRRQSSVGLRRQSVAGVKPAAASQQEVPWDMLDRCLLPVIFCHAAAVILSTLLNILHISQVSTLTLFIWFTITTTAAVLFYHNLKVTAAGKAVLITGCDSRVGGALAKYLDEQGFTVFAGFQNAAESPYAEELKETCSARLHVLQLDVSSETQVLAASLYAVEHLPDGAPGLWAVVHAASWVALGEIEWIPPQVIKKAADINFLGPTRVTQVMLPLVRRARGRIIFISSGLCRVATPVRGIHCGLLAAVEAQAECLRKELRSRGVDVVVVAPGEFTSGKSWLNDDDLLEQAKEMWAQLCQEQRLEYGKDYFETAIRSLEKYTKAQVLRKSSGILRLGIVLSICREPVYLVLRYVPVVRYQSSCSLTNFHQVHHIRYRIVGTNRLLLLLWQRNYLEELSYTVCCFRKYLDTRKPTFQKGSVVHNTKNSKTYEDENTELLCVIVRNFRYDRTDFILLLCLIEERQR